MVQKNSEEKGRLWLYENRYKKNDNHPIKTGPGEIPRSLIRKLVTKAKDDGEDVVKVQCATWERVSKQGNPYTFVTIELDEREERVTSNSPKDSAVDDLPF